MYFRKYNLRAITNIRLPSSLLAKHLDCNVYKEEHANKSQLRMALETQDTLQGLIE